jgi:hypothetical protein
VVGLERSGQGEPLYCHCGAAEGAGAGLGSQEQKKAPGLFRPGAFFAKRTVSTLVLSYRESPGSSAMIKGDVGGCNILKFVSRF